LRLAGTLTGQKTGCVQVSRFRTFDPVDMHGLVHRGGQFGGFQPGLVFAGRVEVVSAANLAP
jgi:hypothetical protein